MREEVVAERAARDSSIWAWAFVREGLGEREERDSIVGGVSLGFLCRIAWGDGDGADTATWDV